jgi:hypothetical protein
MKTNPPRLLAYVATALAILISAGCDNAESQSSSAPPTATPAAKPTLNTQGLTFAKFAYLDEISNAIQDNDTVMTMEEAQKLTGIDIRVDAKTYANEYDANEIAADNKYKGKKILMIGTVTGIHKDITGKGYLSLAGPSMVQDVQARLNEEGMAGAADLSKGVTIYLVCEPSIKVVTIATASNCYRFSQHLEALRPQLEKSVAAFLEGESALPKSLAEAMAAMYIFASALPTDSACLQNGDTCDAEFGKLTEDKERQDALKQQATDFIKTLKTT